MRVANWQENIQCLLPNANPFLRQLHLVNIETGRGHCGKFSDKKQNLRSYPLSMSHRHFGRLCRWLAKYQTHPFLQLQEASFKPLKVCASNSNYPDTENLQQGMPDIEVL